MSARELAGLAATTVKKRLLECGLSPALIRRIAVICYEAEMNVVCHARQGTLTLSLTPEWLRIKVADEGRGIEDIELAMKEGYSTASEEIREKGFGAGMGLPNIKKDSDKLHVASVVGKDTVLEIFFRRR